ncbi:choice-of-anchor I family protein [Flavobacterium alkalisoli]|uniref:choice-of-anchor I family protein n=1 Tax=Flavobacterium alkalisoli TaxID=2602769 RepID=UPI003A8DB25F
MSKNYFTKLLLVLGVLLVSQLSGAQTLIHYWNFNDNASEIAITTPSQSYVTGASITVNAGTGSLIDFAGGTGQNFDVQNLNAQNGDAAGSHLRFNNPIGGGLVFALPTTGFEDIMVKFATRRSGSGAGTQNWYYSTDGTNFTLLTTVTPNNGDPGLATLDLTAITAANNNANFKLKVEFEQGDGGTGGNNRFDNFTAEGAVIGGGDPIAPVATITPANEAINVLVSQLPTISFNEDVRLADNTAITNTNIDAVVELRLNNATGTIVPFDATFADNTITITPAVALLNSQQYYVALLPNTIEDMSDNAITETQSATFTTISVQTAFTAGDMAFVAYRMNASGTEDEIALVTFVDIAPGTFITLTDSKYTTNPQPQCTDGIVWTATNCVPAGSVISIQTGALVASTGIVTGGDFGLSSGGDQVIVYAGTAIAPNYITAMSSNAWLTANTDCGGSNSMLPLGLVDGTSAVNLSTAPGNVDGNTANAYYNGTQEGTPSQLKAAILNPANWVGVAAGTPAQEWPTWGFPSSPTVQNVAVVNATTIELTFNNELNATSAALLTNYTGITGLTTAVANGNVVTLTYATAFEAGMEYTLTVNSITDENAVVMACEYSYTFTYNTLISFDETFIVVNEDAGTLNLVLNLEGPATASVDLVVKASPFSTADANDFTLTTQTLNFTGTSSLTQTIAIAIIDDNEEEQAAEYFVLSLENPVGINITGDSFATIYIKDNDRMAPTPDHSIELDYIGSFDPSGTNESTCEIVVHDPATQRLFTTSAVAGYLDILDFSDPTAPSVVSSINMNTYGGVTSVAVNNGIIAVASPNVEEHLDGSVVFFDTDGTFIAQVTVGALPDNISFTPDGTKVLTANEGQPKSDYTVDPEGSVSIIDISGGVETVAQGNVTTLYFTDYNAQEAALLATGVRKVYAGSTLSQDFEPEYITSSADSQKAWVSLQENNAIAEINLTNNTIADVWSLGTKDMSLPGNGFDISDNNGEVLIANWPIQAYYIPDAVANYNVNGVNYIITANEGDEKEYDNFEERTTIGNNGYSLDATIFPQAAMLKKSFNAGRMRVTNANGNLDEDAEFEQIYCLGTRSFSIFNADTKEIVYDSGDDFEMYTSTDASISALFNSDSEENGIKGRSRAKGPEPEGVTVAQINGKTFAFVGLERVGGVMVYDVTDPADVNFVDYKNSRSLTAYEGDHGPEGITYISEDNSPDGKGYVIIANEISGTLSIYEVNTENLGTGDFVQAPKTFVVFPNPAVDGTAYFNRAADIEVYDLNGKMIHSAKQALKIDTTNMASGIYIVKTSEGIVKKLVVK